MSFIGNLLDILNTKADVPTVFGWFHIVCFLLSIVAGVALCRLFPQGTEKQVRTVLLVTTVLTVILEIYKQINFTFVYNGETIVTDYQWYSFPFQLCSTPMYAGLLAVFTKGRVHHALCAYLASYMVFGGLSVMIYPGSVFIDTVGVNIQTMVCHGSMIAIGIFLVFTNYVKPNVKTLLHAMAVFCVFVGIAVTLNEIAHLTGLTERETFNMFFISPYCEPFLPVYSIAQRLIPYPWCIGTYIAAVTAAAAVALLIFAGIKRCLKRRQSCLKNAL